MNKIVILLSSAFRINKNFLLLLKERINQQNYFLHCFLFVLTFITTSISGAAWMGKPFVFELNALFETILYGFSFSFPFLLILTFHEFGHFFAALYHSVKVSLPYYLPFPPLPSILNIGTMGAVIRIKEKIPNRNSLFDIGIYGPFAGFVISICTLLWGFLTLPNISYLFSIHPEYASLDKIPELTGTLLLGKNLLFILFESLFASKNMPPMTELYHYPYLFAGWLGCVVTGLNLLPVGQLDGGHIIYAMFGENLQRRIAAVGIALIFFLGLPSFLEMLTQIIVTLLFGFDTMLLIEFPTWLTSWSWPSWIIWGLILIKIVKPEHPPVLVEYEITSKRGQFGWFGILMFFLCFTPVPFSYVR